MITLEKVRHGIDSMPLWMVIRMKLTVMWFYSTFYWIRARYAFIKSLVYSRAEYYSRPVRYRITNAILLRRLRIFPRNVKIGIINRWWNIKYIASVRMHRERYINNLRIIANMSKKAGIPQHMMIAAYQAKCGGDLGGTEICENPPCRPWWLSDADTWLLSPKYRRKRIWSP